MNLTRLTIENNRISFTVLLLLVVMGWMAYLKLPRAEDPGYVVRVARVITHFPGASPKRIENLVTDKLEKAIQEMPEVEFISSESVTGTSIVTVNVLEDYTEMRPIWDSLRRKVERVSADLPKGVIGPFVNDEFGDVFGTILTISGDGFSYRELKKVADEVRNEFLSIDEVAKVDIHGAQSETIFVEYHSAKLTDLGASALLLKQILESRNIIIPGGAVQTEQERIVVEPTGNFESVEDLENTIIQIPGTSTQLYLKDLATITRGYVDPPRTKMRSSGEICLGLSVSMREGGNIIRMGKKIERLVKQLQETYPIGIQFDLVAFQPKEVQRKVDEFVGNLIQSIVIVAVIMVVSLGIRTGIVVASLIPLTVLATFLQMSILNIGIDQVSLAALIISLGMLVDNSIVMSESVMNEMAVGKGAFDAAVDSARELNIPLLTSSLTTSMAFFPIYLAKSAAGEYTSSLFSVVTISLMTSWFLSLTAVPMFCAMFLKVRGEREHEELAYRNYRRFLLLLLRNPWKSIAGFVAAFCIALSALSAVPKNFFPPSPVETFRVALEMPEGTKIQRTEEVLDRLEAYMKAELIASEGSKRTGITNWSSFIGESAPRFTLNFAPMSPRPELAYMLVNTNHALGMQALIEQMEEFCATEFPDLTVSIKQMTHGPPVDAPVELRISSRDSDVIFPAVEKVKAKLLSIRGAKMVRDDWGSRTKKLVVHVNQARALRAGVSNQDIAISLQTLLSGFDTTQYREETDVIPVTVRSVASDREDISKLETLHIYAQDTGRSVPLKQVADLEVVWETSKIMRRDGLRTVTIKADIDETVTATDIVKTLKPWLEKQAQKWPRELRIEIGGEVETSAKSEHSIAEQVPVAILLIVLLLVAQFNSFRRATIILLTIPLGLIGVAIGLVVTGSYLGFMTFLGIVSLCGIVINNAIVLIDRIHTEIHEHGRNESLAVLEAAQRRMRPIVLTTLTTVGGLLPLWLGGGAMFEPMAIAIIFGLLFATFLTLGFVPLLYSLFYRVNFDDEEIL